MKLLALLSFSFFYLVRLHAYDPNHGPTKIQKLLRPLGVEAGFSLRDSSGKELLEVNGRNAFPPASVAKLVSSACALRVLSPQFQFETQFGHTGKISNGVLLGDLVIKGAGDPSFVIEDLKEAVEILYTVYGVHEMRGNLVLDLSYLGKKEVEMAKGFEGDQGRSFTATITALPFNFNSFSIWIASPEGKATVQLLPKDVMSTKVLNRAKVSDDGGLSLSADYQIDEDRVVVSGNLPSSLENKAFYRSVPDSYDYFLKTFTRVYRELGGKWAAPKLKTETQAIKFRNLFRHSSQSLSKLLMDINKLSTNFGAELVLLAAAAESRGVPANFEKSRQVLESCLKEMEMGANEIVLENASGLSRSSRIQPSGLTQFLLRASQEDFAPEYLSTLSVLGRDGTYKRRLPKFAGRARLKSGSIAGVNTLAGFVYPEGKGPLLFSIFFKCGSCSRDKLFGIEDQILAILLE